MYKIMFITAILISNLIAANDVYNYNFNEAVKRCIEDRTLDGTVKFYLEGNAIDAKIIKSGVVANKKTNGFTKTPEFSCDWALRSALIYLQKLAKSHGANAVVNIVSYYKANTTSSNITYRCHKGNVITGVALKGDLAVIGDNLNSNDLQNVSNDYFKYDFLSDKEIIKLWQKVKSCSTFVSLIPEDTFNLKLNLDYQVLSSDDEQYWSLENKTDSLGLVINLKNNEENKKIIRSIALKNKTNSVSAKFLHINKENGLKLFVFEIL